MEGREREEIGGEGEGGERRGWRGRREEGGRGRREEGREREERGGEGEGEKRCAC